MQRDIKVGNGFSDQDQEKEGESITRSQTTGRIPGEVFIEQPILNRPDTHPLNGKHGPDDEDEDEAEEDDLILGDEDEAGDEEEFDVELEEDFGGSEIDDDDLVIDSDDEVEDEEDDL